MSAKRRIFIGDVQGCLQELVQLLEAVGFDPTQDEVHPTGDLINRGPDSANVLRLLRSIDAGGVLGNHDVHALRVARGVRELGPDDNLDELFSASDSEELLGWLASRPFARTWDDVLLVHAGVNPTWRRPEKVLRSIDPHAHHRDSEFATRARYCDAKGKRPESDWPVPPVPFVPWYQHWRAREEEERTVVFGHWARAGLVNSPQVRGLDTGCVYGRELTAWIAEEDRIVSVPAVKAWALSD